ncbi:hypothetical protein WAF95_19680 [Xanthomonas perforans]
MPVHARSPMVTAVRCTGCSEEPWGGGGGGGPPRPPPPPPPPPPKKK